MEKIKRLTEVLCKNFSNFIEELSLDVRVCISQVLDGSDYRLYQLCLASMVNQSLVQ